MSGTHEGREIGVTRGHIARKRVSFGSVIELQFEVGVGDNPAVLSGVPLTLEWDVLKRTSYDIDSYCNLRQSKRSTKELLIPHETRMEILLCRGHSLDEITSATRETMRIKDSRLANRRGRKQRDFNQLYAALIHSGHRCAMKTRSVAV